MSLGETLKDARESRGLALSTIEEEIKIRKKYLIALENEDFEALPGRAYAKAFLRTYASYLRLDVEEVNAQFDVLVPPDNQEPEIQESPAFIKKKKSSGYRSFLLVAGVIILLVAFNALYSSLMSGERETNFGPGIISSENQGNEDEAPPPNEEENTEPGTPEQLTLILQSTEGDSWVQVNVDGEEVFSGLMTIGEEQQFTGDSISIVLGNAGAVEVVVNDDNLGTLGGPGEVVNRDFTTEE